MATLFQFKSTGLTEHNLLCILYNSNLFIAKDAEKFTAASDEAKAMQQIKGITSDFILTDKAIISYKPTISEAAAQRSSDSQERYEEQKKAVSNLQDCAKNYNIYIEDENINALFTEFNESDTTPEAVKLANIRQIVAREVISSEANGIFVKDKEVIYVREMCNGALKDKTYCISTEGYSEGYAMIIEDKTNTVEYKYVKPEPQICFPSITEEQESEKFAEAKATGKAVVIRTVTVPEEQTPIACDGEGDMVTCYEIALPDGSRTIEYQHNY